jgi:hypothetical protein
MSPNLIGEEKNIHQDNKLITSGKYQKCLPYFDKYFFMLDALFFILKLLTFTVCLMQSLTLCYNPGPKLVVLSGF